MNKYECNGFRSVRSDGMNQAAKIFAARAARKIYGRRGDARTTVMGSYSQDGTFAEFSAFIGTTRDNETTGHNIHFTLRRVTGAGLEVA